MDTTDNTPTAAVITPRCPISFAMNMLGDRWSLLIIRDMMLFGRRRYSEFLASSEGISTNILAARLKQMQQLDLVEKFSDPSNRKASVYLLTDKGLRLFPVLLEVIRWGQQHDERSMITDAMAQALRDGGQPLARQIQERVESERLQLQSS
jgi:DNA-binding HxlR family transcriptional regulator